MNDTVLVYADWEALPEPMLVGTLRSTRLRNKEHFSFEYAKQWLLSKHAQKIDPELELYQGEQHSTEDNANFRAFLDSCPDRWGRLLIKRREAVIAAKEQRKPNFLTELDYLLAVHDTSRMGALRFKRSLDGDFLDNNTQLSAPPFSAIPELEFAAQKIESNEAIDDPGYIKWLYQLISPGSSLGGARPKASVTDRHGSLWIAKFPSRYDAYDIGAWEKVAYVLATNSNISMADCAIKQFNSHHHTFLTRRFDRHNNRRVHFSSAMTQLKYFDGEAGASYLDLAQFITENGSNTKSDLAQLWRRLVFNIAISNTDDHLRNHGFVFDEDGWKLSPAYDLNPSIESDGLSLFITDNDNRLDFNLALDVIDFFQLSAKAANKILDEVKQSVNQWQSVATEVGIPRGEQQLLAPAFNV